MHSASDHGSRAGLGSAEHAVGAVDIAAGEHHQFACPPAKQPYGGLRVLLGKRVNVNHDIHLDPVIVGKSGNIGVDVRNRIREVSLDLAAMQH